MREREGCRSARQRRTRHDLRDSPRESAIQEHFHVWREDTRWRRAGCWNDVLIREECHQRAQQPSDYRNRFQVASVASIVKADGVDLIGRNCARGDADRDMRWAVLGIWVAKLPELRRVGVRILEVVEHCMRAHPSVVRAVLRSMEDRECHVRHEDVQELADSPAKGLGTRTRDASHTAVIDRLSDQDTVFPDWLAEWAPTGGKRDFSAKCD